MSIILFIVILGTLVLVHELGHFIAAKRAGIRVDEFGIGFPPRLFKKKVGETLYSINLFPFGGFVKIFGENPDKESIEGQDFKRSLVKKPKLVQAWVLVAGIVFNLLFAWLVLSVGFMVGMPYSVDDSAYAARIKNPALTIAQVLPGSPAQIAGLKGGDKITVLTAGKIIRVSPNVKETQDFIANNAELSITFLRGAELKTVVVRPETGIVGSRGVVGISLDTVGILKLSPVGAVYLGAKATASLTYGTVVGMAQFFKNIFSGQGNFSEISGPVGIVSVVQDARALGFAHIVSLIALISINLAVINILPFPALDGGRLFFLLIEAIKRSPIKSNVANVVNGIGFMLLVALMIFVTYHDVLKLIRN